MKGFRWFALLVALLGALSASGGAVAQDMSPARIAAITQAPVLKTPIDGTPFQTMAAITMTWTLPTGTTQYQIQVIPAKNDGPGINLIRDAATTYTIDPPVLGQGPYVILPGMTYTWRVRATDKTISVDEGDPSWGPWSSDFTFTTPAPSAATIIPVEPPTGATVSSLTPRLRWQDSNGFIFYYELQLSKDQTFNTDPSTATASVYMNLIHGGQADPTNSWSVPANYPLEVGTRYFWRVRPRVQGSGTPVNWSALFFFSTPGGTPSATATPTPPAGTSSCSWTGTWDTGKDATHLTQSGNTVTGTYEYHSGLVNGTALEAMLSGRWDEDAETPGGDGGFVWTISADCSSFSGTWGFGSSSTDLEWNGTRRVSTTAPTPVATATPTPRPLPPPPASPTPTPTTPPATSSCNWTGTWSTNFNAMYLYQSSTIASSVVSGTYEWDDGRVLGHVSGNQLIGSWSEAPSYTEPDDAGHFVWTISADCNSFSGTWGYGDASTGSSWTGTRMQ